MKRSRLLICLLFICAKGFSQSIIYKDVTDISKQEFDKHLPVIHLLSKTSQEKVHHKIVITTVKRTIVLKDDGEMKEYRYVGDLKNDHLAVIHELEPNTEEYYFINRNTGTIDTLVDKPVFYPNSKMVASLEGMGTDVRQRIQIGEITNGRLKTIFFFRLKFELHIHPGYIYWFDKHTLFLNDNNEKFYKLTF
ncbi:MAG: hypothetical protein JSU01_06075 [Bacteroidetes bacterium]|nr:hypothetical protein [Bacteroidota bacterium]